MSQYIRWSLLGEIKDLFKRHKATYIGPYDAERKNFTKNLVRQLKPQRTVDSARTLYNILVSELQLTFQDVKRLPFLIKNPEDPRFTQNLLHFINHAKLYKMGIQFTYELIGEFKNTLRILGSDPTTWESQPENDEFIWDLLYALKSSDIVCSSCHGFIHNEDLKYKVLGLRKKISQSYYQFSIDVPIYCCRCHEILMRSYDQGSSPLITVQAATNAVNSLRQEMLEELRRLLAIRRNQELENSGS